MPLSPVRTRSMPGDLLKYGQATAVRQPVIQQHQIDTPQRSWRGYKPASKSVETGGQRVLDERGESVHFERLVQDGKGAKAAGLQEELRTAVSHHQDNGRMRRQAAHHREHAKVVAVGQPQVKEDDVYSARAGRYGVNRGGGVTGLGKNRNSAPRPPSCASSAQESLPTLHPSL